MLNGKTVSEFKVWAKNNQELAIAACQAKAMAQVERERVDKYIQPIFARYGFKDEDGVLIKSQDELYLSQDEDAMTAFFAECDLAHRQNGCTGKEGFCPALIAEDLQRKAECALIDSGQEFLGIGEIYVAGEDRKKLLGLLLGACMLGVSKAQAMRTKR